MVRAVMILKPCYDTSFINNSWKVDVTIRSNEKKKSKSDIITLVS